MEGGVCRIAGARIQSSTIIEDTYYKRKHSVLRQAFNWESCNSGNWWGEVEAAAGEIAEAGFSLAWLPPPTDSVSRQGYMPTDLYNLNSNYGSADALNRWGGRTFGIALQHFVLRCLIKLHADRPARPEQRPRLRNLPEAVGQIPHFVLHLVFRSF